MYENAVEAARKHGFDGVGLVIPPGYGGIDENGHLHCFPCFRSSAKVLVHQIVP